MCCRLVSYVAYASVTDDDRRHWPLLICPPTLCVGGPVIRLIFASRRHHHVTPLPYSLHWLRVPEWITFWLAVLAYRCHHGSAPAYLASELFPVLRASRCQRLRSSSTTDLAILRVSHATRYKNHIWFAKYDDSSISRSRDIIAAPKFNMGHVTLTMPLSGMLCQLSSVG